MLSPQGGTDTAGKEVKFWKLINPLKNVVNLVAYSSYILSMIWEERIYERFSSIWKYLLQSKWSNTLKQFVGDHCVWLALKGLINTMERIGSGRLFLKNLLEILISWVFVGVHENKEGKIMNFGYDETEL